MKITLIGSTQFIPAFHSANAVLSKMGHTVYALSIYDRSLHDSTGLSKTVLDLVHLNKILNSDLTILVGDQGYLGYSTSREILWCQVVQRPVLDLRGWDFIGPHNLPLLRKQISTFSYETAPHDNLLEEASQIINCTATS